MYKLLIVDDEVGVREGLKKMIQWDEYGIEICCEAENGEQALAIVKELHPHIIFTDIRMPVMDGIAFIEKLKEIQRDCKVVVLSGFNEFDLVRQAMRNGAVDYILKPSGKDEIKNVIAEIIDNMEDEVISRLKNSEHLQLLRNNVLNRVIRNDISSRELKEKLDFLELGSTKGYLSTAVIKLVDNYEDEAANNWVRGNDLEDKLQNKFETDNLSSDSRAWKIFAIYNVCNEMIGLQNNGVVFTDAAGYVVVIFKEVSQDAVDVKIKNIMDNFVTYIHKTLKINVSIAVGSVVNAYRNLYKSYNDAIKTLEYQFVFGMNCILFYQEIKNYFQNTNNSIEIEYDLITRLIEENQYNELEKHIKKLFVPFYNKYKLVDGYVLRNCAMEIIILACQNISTMSMIEHQRILKLKEEALHKVVTENSLINLQDTILNTLKFVIEERTISKQNKYSKLVYEMINNIENNYADTNLSLQSLADSWGVNTAYLGRVFKKETNHSFTNYLNVFRVEKAKKLFQTTNYKGTDICEKVGFANYNYFYIVFRKIEGKNPTDIRK